jgi:hypothetical protein
MTDNEGFFSKRHVFAAGWATIFAVAGYGARLILEARRGPEHVIVTNMPTIPQPVRTTAELDQKTEAELLSMVASVKLAIREIQSSQKHASAAANVNSQARIQDLESKIAKIQAAAASSKAAEAQTTLSALAQSLTKAQAELSTKSPPPRQYAKLIYPVVESKAAPIFELPASSKGYILGYDAKLLRSFTCPQSSLIGGKADIRAVFTVSDSQTVNRMSPLWMILMEKKPDKNERELKYSTYVPVKVGPNIIELTTDLDAGQYILRTGYFLLEKLSGDYPPYYSRDCALDIK